MNKYMSRTARAIMLVAVIILLLTTLSFQNVFAESETRANSATSFVGVNFVNRLTGDSYVTGLGSHAKITLYLATTNDPAEISLNMGNVAATRKDGENMYVKFGESIFVKADKGTNLPTSVFVNKETNKLDTLVDFKKGNKTAPLYNNSTRIAPSDMVSQLDIPKWLKDDAKTSRQEDVVLWMMNSSNKFQNLYNLVFQVAEKSDPAKAKDRDAVQNVLNSTLSKASFKYTDTGRPMTLSENDVMPGENYAYWLVVYEPLIYYSQDPNKMFYPKQDAGDYLFTATDAVLVNAKAGSAGYPPAKFAAGTPGLNLHSNHCRKCDFTWYGYPNWNPEVPFAYFCPPPCPAVSKYYDGEQVLKRYPFAIPSPILLAARTFTVKEDWMKYSGGHLVDKPTGEIDSVISSASDIDDILHYGGYSVFINGPTATNPTLYARAVVVDEDFNFVEIPGTEIKMSIKNDPEKVLSVKTPASGYIGMGMIPNIDVQALVPQAVSKPANPDEILTERLFIKESEDFLTPLTTGELEDFKKEIEASIGRNIQMDDIVLFDGDTLAAYINLDVLYKSTDELGWDSVEIVLSQDYIYDMQDATKYGAIYNPESKTWSASDGFDWTAGKDAFLTVIIPAVVKNDVIETPIAPSSNFIAENELIKAMSGNTISTVSLSKTCTDTGCDGTKRESYTYTETDPKTGKKVTKTGSRTVSCGHSQSLANAKNITPNTLSVQPGWYWGLPMFNNISKLSALRSGSLSDNGVNFAFNQTGVFTADNMSNVFSALTGYKFLTHRNAGQDSKTLQLAGYMNGSQLNKAFQSFINPYYGTYPSAYSNPTGNFGERDFNLITSLPLPSNVTAIGSGNICSGGVNNNLSIPSKLTSGDGTFKTQTNIQIAPTIQESDRTTPVFKADQTYWGIGDPNLAPSLYVRIPSQPISFYPTFKMDYDNKNDGSSSSQVWMLASGKRTFNSDDMVMFSLPEEESSIKVDCAWSRDREDKYIDPKQDKPRARKIPTAKSGSALKCSTGDGTVLKIDVIYHIQDPSFTDNPTETQKHNDDIAASYDSMVKDIRDYLKNGGVSFYSNLLQANTPNTLHFLSFSSKVPDLSSKTTLKLGAPVTVDVGLMTEVALLDTNNIIESDPIGARTIKVQGKAYKLNRIWNDINAIKSKSVLNSLLVKNGGVAVKNWYSEQYEGIILVHKAYFLTIHAETGYTQIHPALSDALTPRNQLACRLPFIYDSKLNLIEDGQFGIGLEVRLPKDLSLPDGTVISQGVLPSKIFTFDLRGSIYDTK